ncbi:substrate-binding periplasmic protein [Hahella chejuensis]|nr:transporter substrate-binding domain-containing protein [Hahella chejuensis]
MKALSIIAFLLLLAGYTRADAQSIVLLMDESYPPYSYSENREAKGIYVDFIREAMRSIPDYKVSFKPLPWKRALNLVETGRAFAVFPPYYRPVSRSWMDYSVPLFKETVVLFTPPELLERLKPTRWPEDYKGLRIGLQLGFATLSPQQKELFVISESPNILTNLKQIALNRIDGHPNDYLSVVWTLEHNRKDPALVNLEITPAAIINEEVAYLAFSNIHPEQWTYREDFIAKMNQSLARMRDKNRLQQIVDKWTRDVNAPAAGY